jgi:hypothetical protein
VAGRAFQRVAMQSSGERGDRLWLPLLDGTVRLGVLAVQLPDRLSSADPDVTDGCLAIASLLGHLIQVKTALGDTIEILRRTTAMSVGSELLWKLVTPPTFIGTRLAITAVVEPSYDAGGDGYDYAIDGSRARVVILDALGHGLPAALTCAVALSAERAARRDGQSLETTLTAVDTAITEQWQDSRFATAVIADIDLDTGWLSYANAGHPPPALVRDSRIVRLLDGGRRLPLGLPDDAPQLGRVRLQPGDRVLFYTDGITEARSPDGSLFGLSRLVGLVERHSATGMPTAEVIRRVARAVIDHQRGLLQDDATLLLAEWSTDAAHRDLP